MSSPVDTRKEPSRKRDSACQRLRPRKSPEFLVPGPGGGAFVEKEFFAAQGVAARAYCSVRPGGKNLFYTPRKTSCKEFKCPDPEESGDKPHSNCPAGRR